MPLLPHFVFDPGVYPGDDFVHRTASVRVLHEALWSRVAAGVMRDALSDNGVHTRFGPVAALIRDHDLRGNSTGLDGSDRVSAIFATGLAHVQAITTHDATSTPIPILSERGAVRAWEELLRGEGKSSYYDLAFYDPPEDYPSPWGLRNLRHVLSSEFLECVGGGPTQGISFDLALESCTGVESDRKYWMESMREIQLEEGRQQEALDAQLDLVRTAEIDAMYTYQPCSPSRSVIPASR